MIRFADFKDVEQIARLHVENVRRTHEGYSEVYLNRFNEERQKKLGPSILTGVIAGLLFMSAKEQS